MHSLGFQPPMINDIRLDLLKIASEAIFFIMYLCFNNIFHQE